MGRMYVWEEGGRGEKLWRGVGIAVVKWGE